LADLRGLGTPGKLDLLRGAVWLAEDTPPRFSHEGDRGRLQLELKENVNDPIEQVRRLLRGPLKLPGSDVQAVCYSFLGP